MQAILHRSALPVALACALAIACSHRAFAQAQSINGSICGIVADSTGAAIAGASVTIRNVETGYVREVKTDEAGLYIAPALPIGTYSVSASSSSFPPLIRPEFT
jgi:hypothetical protein